MCTVDLKIGCDTLKSTKLFAWLLVVLMALVACNTSSTQLPSSENERSLQQLLPAQTEEPSDPLPDTPVTTEEPSEQTTNTSSAFEGLYVDRVWLILTEIGEESATVQMWFFPSNNNDSPSDQLRLAMPLGVTDVFVDNMGYVVEEEDGQVFVVRRDPLPANSNDELLIVDYQLPLAAFDDLTYQIAYPTANLAVYLPQVARPQFEVQQLAYQDIRLLRGLGDFLLFATETPILADEPLTFDITPADSMRYTPDTEFVDFSVSVEHGTANATLPETLPLVLLSVRIGDDGSETLLEQRQLDWTVGEPVSVSQMPSFPNGFIEARILHEGVTFWARLDALEALSNSELLTVTIYDTTDDPSVVQLASVWFVVDAVTGEGLAEYRVWYFFTNTSDRIYVGAGDEQNLFELPLPANLQGLNFQEELGPGVGVNFVNDVPYIVDNRLIFPEQIQPLPFEFFLEYDGELTLSYDIGYPVDSVVVYTSDFRQLAFEGEAFEDTGPEELPGLGTYNSYTKLGHPAGVPIEFTIADTDATPQVESISQAGDAPVTDEPSFFEENRWFIFGLGVLMVLMGGMYLVYDLQKERIRVQATIATAQATVAEPMDQQTLVEKIAALDDAYERGEITERDYQAQREALRDKLRQYMES